MNIIRIQSDELQEIIRDHLPNTEDAEDILTAIMEDVAKSNPFKVWRR